MEDTDNNKGILNAFFVSYPIRVIIYFILFSIILFPIGYFFPMTGLNVNFLWLRGAGYLAFAGAWLPLWHDLNHRSWGLSLHLILFFFVSLMAWNFVDNYFFR